MGLRLKFNLVLVVVFTVGLIIAGFLSDRILRQNAEEEALQNAGIMMQSAQAIREYTVKEVRPLLKQLKTEKFLPQTVPAYAATQNFNALRSKYPAYTYKEAVLNPTNPAHKATDWETDIIDRYRNHPDDLTELTGRRKTQSDEFLFIARPMKIKNPGCLSCHSTVAEAPPALVAQYGPANGFGWKMDEIVGAQIVSVPMSVPLARAHKAFFTFMGSLLIVFLMIGIVLNGLLHWLVISPVTRLARLAGDVSRGQMDSPEFEVGGKDEVALLASSFTRMRRSLESALKMLE